MTSNTPRRHQSKANKRPSRQAPSLSPVTMASSITGVLIQIQVTAQGGPHDLLPILIAVLLLVAGSCRPDQPET
jgi:hypothetical protein